MRGMVSVVELAEVRKRAFRRGAWFRVLSRVERAIVTLTIRCVEEVRSPKLTEMLVRIMGKMREAMKSRVDRVMETVGRQLAQGLSHFAEAWGNSSAFRWAWDPGFIRFNAIMHINAPRLFVI